MRRALAAFLSVVPVAACSLFTSLDGYSGAAPTVTEGGIDSAVTTGGDANEDGPSSFCATQTDAQFCESFDDGPLPGAFDERAASGAVMALDSTLAASPKSSVAVTLAPETSTVEHYGGLFETLPANSTSVTMGVKLHIVKVPTVTAQGPRADMLSFECDNGTDGAGAFSSIVIMRPSPSGNGAEVLLSTYTNETDSSSDLTSFTPLPLGIWQELRFRIDWTKLEVSLEAFDGNGPVLIGAGRLTPPGSLTLPPPRCKAIVGLYTFLPNDGWSVRFDDVVVRTR